ncbi:MAG: metallophosphoesterase [Rhodoluna sp.]|nr:metallophosphoesterase [Rhodoluna sp.]
MFWLWLVLGLGALVFAWAALVERNLFTVKYDSVAVLPKGAAPIRVLHISDIHMAPWQKRKQRWISKLAELKVDLVIDTGDNLGHVDAVKPVLEALSPLIELPGVFVNGSNDYHAPGFRNPFNYLFKPSTPMPGKALDTAKLLNGLEKSWLNLNNRNGELNVKGTRIGFVGLDDPHDQLAEYDSISTPRGTDVLIGVAHAPYRRVIEELGDCAIIFAGHTHGGQVWLPGGRAIVTNCDLPAKNARGLSGWSTAKGETILNVCAGLGTSIFAPVRLFCRPEVRLLTLLPKN